MSKTKITSLADDRDYAAAKLKSDQLERDATAKREYIASMQAAIRDQRTDATLDVAAERLLQGGTTTATTAAIYSADDLANAQRELKIIERAQTLHAETVKRCIADASLRLKKTMRPEFRRRLKALVDASRRLSDANDAVKSLYEQVEHAGYLAGSVYQTGGWLDPRVVDLADTNSRFARFLGEAEAWIDGGDG